MLNNNHVLIRNGYMEVPNVTSSEVVLQQDVATIMMNLSYYGYALNEAAYKAICGLSYEGLASWWKEVETCLKEISGQSRNIGSFVVYKNFPAEVLSKTESEYWLPQILMYWGFPNEFFTQEVLPRKEMSEKGKSLVLRLAKEETLLEVLNTYLRSPARWKDSEFADVLYLTSKVDADLSQISFKENLVSLITSFISQDRYVNVSTATDVLRLAVGLSDGDVSLRENTKFISFKKPVRKFLLAMLEECNNLAEDVGRRPEVWKRLFHQLHPGDYKKRFSNVCKVMDDLYKSSILKPNSALESLLRNKDSEALELLVKRPGDFKRRLVHALDLFGLKTVDAFRSKKVLKNLTTFQLVSLKTLLKNNNSKTKRVFPPKGNWNKLKLGEPRLVNENYIEKIVIILNEELKSRLPKVKVLDELTKYVKLPTNNEVSPFNRGTVFPIPEEVKFIRTASFWKTGINKLYRDIWFDNGWNFFDENFNSRGACCWNAVNFSDDAAIFSGDPTNSKELEGRAAQLIDLYPDKLVKSGVRYAVWNILCFSKMQFSDAEDVFAALQWGEEPQEGDLFEPSRCQLSFPLKSKQLTKYVCLIDLKKREMIYIDANLNGAVHSATHNAKVLQEQMPAFLDYINAIPSVYDLFESSVDDSGEANILYSDKEVSLKDVSAYVFKLENKDNVFKQIDLNQLLK